MAYLEEMADLEIKGVPEDLAPLGQSEESALLDQEVSLDQMDCLDYQGNVVVLEILAELGLLVSKDNKVMLVSRDDLDLPVPKERRVRTDSWDLLVKLVNQEKPDYKVYLEIWGMQEGLEKKVNVEIKV